MLILSIPKNFVRRRNVRVFLLFTGLGHLGPRLLVEQVRLRVEEVAGDRRVCRGLQVDEVGLLGGWDGGGQGVLGH